MPVFGFPEHLFEFGKTISGSDKIAANRLCSLELERSKEKTAERSDVFFPCGVTRREPTRVERGWWKEGARSMRVGRRGSERNEYGKVTCLEREIGDVVGR
jgi:hypothetical protein